MGWERDEWWAALRGPQQPIADCGNGCHDMVRQTGGGGVCLVCGLSVDREEL